MKQHVQYLQQEFSQALGGAFARVSHLEAAAAEEEAAEQKRLLRGEMEQVASELVTHFVA